MIKKVFIFTTILSLMAISFSYGILTIHWRVFPFDQINEVLKSLKVQPVYTEYFYHKKSFFEENGRADYDIVMIGDSLTDRADWQDFFPELKIANRGISGDMSEGLLKRANSIYSTSASKAFVMIGINDLNRGKSVDEVFNNYETLVQGLLENRIQVVIQSTLYAGKRKTYLNKFVQALNFQLKNLANTNSNITYLDINKVLAPNGELRDKFSLDGIHLNGEAYKLWSKLLATKINK